MKTVRVAAVQMDPKIREKEHNLGRVLELIREASKKRAKLIVFPECALTGYYFSSLKDAAPHAEGIPGPSASSIADLCREESVYVIVGLLERDGGRCYNAAALLGPKGLIGSYRKIHLPCEGVDRFVSPGDRPFKTYATEVGRIGMMICYDASVTESCRVLALMGAEVVALPTNWSRGVEMPARHVVNVRAYENGVNFITANRVGVEEDFRFIGSSKIIDHRGHTLAEAGEEETIIYTDIDPEAARDKRMVIVKGAIEADLFGARRPELYGAITMPKERVPSNT